eukprot:7168654-Alexandrium_andersonii.AAC.1
MQRRTSLQRLLKTLQPALQPLRRRRQLPSAAGLTAPGDVVSAAGAATGAAAVAAAGAAALCRA